MENEFSDLIKKHKEIRKQGSGFPYGFCTWFGSVAACGKRLGYWDYAGSHLFYALQHLDAEAWRDNYFMEGYSPYDAVREDMSNL